MVTLAGETLSSVSVGAGARVFWFVAAAAANRSRVVLFRINVLGELIAVNARARNFPYPGPRSIFFARRGDCRLEFKRETTFRFCLAPQNHGLRSRFSFIILPSRSSRTSDNRTKMRAPENRMGRQMKRYVFFFLLFHNFFFHSLNRRSMRRRYWYDANYFRIIAIHTGNVVSYVRVTYRSSSTDKRLISADKLVEQIARNRFSRRREELPYRWNLGKISIADF